MPIIAYHFSANLVRHLNNYLQYNGLIFRNKIILINFSPIMSVLGPEIAKVRTCLKQLQNEQYIHCSYFNATIS